MTSDKAIEDLDITSQQEARAILRESFLKGICELNGQPCSLLTYEKSTLSATFSGYHPDGTEILVHDLTTPACIKMKTSLLRTPDILAVQFDIPIEMPE